MKKGRKHLSISVLVFLLMIFNMNVSAAVDPSGDLFHYVPDETENTEGYYEKYNGEKPNIDIVDLSYEITDTQLLVLITVDGVIQDKEGLFYYVVVLYADDSINSLAYYTNTVYYVLGDNPKNESYEFTSKAGNDTILFTIDYDNTSKINGVWCYTYEVEDVTVMTNGEYWGDWMPDTYFPDYPLFYEDLTDDTGTNDDMDNTDATDGKEDVDSGTPGFEILTLLVTIGVVLILLRKKK